MKVTGFRIRDLASFFAISGILLLTASRYVETNACRCEMNKRLPGFNKKDEEALKRWLREMLVTPEMKLLRNSNPIREE